uniref:Polypeptide n=1 Tax=Trypanosoma brucei TaxID=5691 RepID=Q26788_9TRYP|nr:polypeptide [Trypanosoma brucei brucei]
MFRKSSELEGKCSSSPFVRRDSHTEASTKQAATLLLTFWFILFPYFSVGVFLLPPLGIGHSHMKALASAAKGGSIWYFLWRHLSSFPFRPPLFPWRKASGTVLPDDLCPVRSIMNNSYKSVCRYGGGYFPNRFGCFYYFVGRFKVGNSVHFQKNCDSYIWFYMEGGRAENVYVLAWMSRKINSSFRVFSVHYVIYGLAFRFV